MESIQPVARFRNSGLSRLPIAVCFAAIFAAASSTWAASQTWKASPTNGTWITTTNWVGGAFPGDNTGGTTNADVATFLTSSTTAITLPTTLNINAFTFGDGTNAASAFTLSGGTLSLTANTWVITTLGFSSSTQTISSPIVLLGSGLVSGGFVTAGGNITVSGGISGTGFGFVKNGANPTGTLTLSGTNTYTGTTNAQTGITLLDMSGGGSLASTTALALGASVSRAGTFQIKGASSGASTQTLGALSLGNGNGASGDIIALNANGGSGVTLTLGNAWTRGGTGTTLLLDYSQGGTGSTVKTAGATTGITLSNGLYGSVLVKDSNSVIGFATRDSGTGNILRYDDTTGTTLAGSSNSATTNFTTLNTTYTSGTLTLANSARSMNSLTIDTTNNGGTIDLVGSSDIVTLTSLGVLFKGANNETVTNGQLGAASSEVIVHQTGAGTLTISSLVGGSASSLTKDGAGTLVLTNASNNLSGGVFVNGGVLESQVQGALGASPNVSLSGNATLRISSTQTITTLGFGTGSNATIEVTGANKLTTTNGIAAWFTKTGTGTWEVDGGPIGAGGANFNIYGGTMIVNRAGSAAFSEGNGIFNLNIGNGSTAATVQYGSAGQITANVIITIADQGKLDLNGFNSTAGMANITMNGGSITTGAGILTLGGPTTGSTALFRYTGTSAQAAVTGKLALPSINAVPSTTTFSVADGTQAEDLVISAVISEAVTGDLLTKTGAGALVLSGANTYTGVTTAAEGKLVVGANAPSGSAGAFGNASSNVVLGSASLTTAASILTDGAFTVGRNIAEVASPTSSTLSIGGTQTSGTSTYTGNITLTKATTLTSATGGEVDFTTGVISGTFDTTIDGGGTVKLTGTNTFGTGKTTTIQNASTLLLSASAPLGNSTNALTFNNGTLKFGAAFDPTVRTLTMGAGGGTFDTNSFNVSLAHAMSGSGAFTKTGTGTLTLAGGSLGAGSVSVTGGTLDLGTQTITNSIAGLSNGSTISDGTFNHTGGSYAVQDGTISAVLNGNGGLTKSGAGTVTLSGANGYSGTTSVTNGTLAQGAAGAFNANSAFSVSSPGVVDLENIAGTLGGLSGSGTVQSTGGSADLTVSGGGSFSGSIASSIGQLTKSGAGSLELTGTNSYTGSTVVTAGTLVISSSAALSSGTVNVQTNGTLVSGADYTMSHNVVNNGTIDAAGFNLTIGSGKTLSGTGLLTSSSGSGVFTVDGTLSPGNSPGTVTVDAFTTLTLDAGATTIWQLNALVADGTGTAGTNWDTFVLNSFSTMNLDGTLQIGLDGISFSSDPYWLTDHTYTLFSGGGVGDQSGGFSSVTGNSTHDFLTGTGTFSYTPGSNVIDYTFVAVPEPQTWALAALGLSAVLFRLRRKQRG